MERKISRESEQAKCPLMELENAVQQAAALMELLAEKLAVIREGDGGQFAGEVACGFQHLCWTTTAALKDSAEATRHYIHALELKAAKGGN